MDIRRVNCICTTLILYFYLVLFSLNVFGESPELKELHPTQTPEGVLVPCGVVAVYAVSVNLENDVRLSDIMESMDGGRKESHTLSEIKSEFERLNLHPTMIKLDFNDILKIMQQNDTSLVLTISDKRHKMHCVTVLDANTEGLIVFDYPWLSRKLAKEEVIDSMQGSAIVVTRNRGIPFSAKENCLKMSKTLCSIFAIVIVATFFFWKRQGV